MKQAPAKSALLVITLVVVSAFAYETLQGPTELRFWDKAKAFNGYTLFGTRGASYLIDMEGRVLHTGPSAPIPAFWITATCWTRYATTPAGSRVSGNSTGRARPFGNTSRSAKATLLTMIGCASSTRG